MRNKLFWAALVPVVLMTGCATEKPMLPPPLDLPKKVQEYATMQPGAAMTEAPSTQVSETPKPPPADLTGTVKTPPPQAPAAAEKADITLAFEQMPLPSFIQMVYGTILKRNVSIDPAIVARQDLVTIRTGAPQTAAQAAEAARMLLKSYGIAVVDLGSIVRIVPDDSKVGYLPEIRRGRALPETPLPLRPIFQLVELQAVRNTDIANWIRTMFGDKVHLQEDPNRNAVWLNGQPDDVTAALEAIHVLDQPLMKGRHSVRITPVFMSADELTKKLTEILQAEGYSAGPPGGISLPVTLVPIPAVNAIIAFAGDQAILDHVVAWAKDLDKPGANGIGRSLFSYQVKYTDAQALATTLDKILGGAPAVKPAAGVAATPLSSRVVVDQTSNTIIFQGSNEDYGQIKSLLEMLDHPSKEALIEVTVAEVSLTNNSQLGVEWLINQANISGSSVVAGTLGGLGIGSAGFNYRAINGAGNRQLLLNALASDNRATIISSPRVMARNGETATIQVGQQVPVITSQQTIPISGTTPSVVQSVQYVNTGVILKVRPVIHSGNQVDLDISQEVSAAQTTTTGVNSSPTISTRKIDTKLSINDGATVLLGGLISSNGSQGDAGIPLLKDIPGLGQLFRTNTDTNDRTELIILITPYIISSDSDAQAVTAAFKKQLGPWAETVQPAKPSPAENGAPVKTEDKHVE
ncbi:MAG TPA: type II secretion system protein GspD [Rhodocyclaceae bacterium]|nr:type II secretion system protein GspD [Rhodocyclaceae bacterium]